MRVRSVLLAEKRTNKYHVVALVDNSNQSDGALSKFSSLQSRLLDLQPVPVLLILSIESILPTLHRYMQEFGKHCEIMPQPNLLPTSLVAYATTSSQPLTQHNANVLTDICHSMRGLEEATRTESGRATLADFLGSVVANDTVDFWEDEWIAQQC
ncbi:hypothetical protein H2200_005243 [Cladophialophora chaetospira]|uniref:Uncharacterized protein n=1 Tax=Cladophialophora chaetospira TaxID=386627 RepID=A0AA38XC76_9EURO|nr:hypothetical protein H2200_005243 [Cladophialophora chaetospira]